MLSILEEGISSLEIIVVDDGSNDSTLETVADLSITAVRLPRNTGAAAARNSGLVRAKGRFISFFDSDDLLFPGSLKWRLDYLKSCPNEEAVGGIIEDYIDADGERFFYPRCEVPERLTTDFFKKGGVFSGCLPLFMFKSSLLSKVGQIDNSFHGVHDLEYLLRILNHSAIPLFPRPTFYYRLHSENLILRKGACFPTIDKLSMANQAFVQLIHGIPL